MMGKKAKTTDRTADIRRRLERFGGHDAIAVEEWEDDVRHLLAELDRTRTILRAKGYEPPQGAPEIGDLRRAYDEAADATGHRQGDTVDGDEARHDAGLRAVAEAIHMRAAERVMAICSAEPPNHVIESLMGEAASLRTEAATMRGDLERAAAEIGRLGREVERLSGACDGSDRARAMLRSERDATVARAEKAEAEATKLRRELEVTQGWLDRFQGDYATELVRCMRLRRESEELRELVSWLDTWGGLEGEAADRARAAIYPLAPVADASEVAAALIAAVKASAELVGCGDSLCLFVRPSGMATNGGCQCLRRPFVGAALARLFKAASAIGAAGGRLEKADDGIIGSEACWAEGGPGGTRCRLPKGHGDHLAELGPWPRGEP
jgi:hypothetical protein